VTELPALLSPYHRELWDHKQMVEELRPHNTSFEVSRALIARWVAQEWLEENGWQARWEDLCEAEVEGWE
jgi:IS30 family transposase